MDDNDIVIVPIEDSIDLHTFRPAEVADLLTDYFEACLEKGFHEVRVIHGKGTGALRERVHAFLKRCDLVQDFSLAGPQGGGWGATMVRLVREKNV